MDFATSFGERYAPAGEYIWMWQKDPATVLKTTDAVQEAWDEHITMLTSFLKVSAPLGYAQLLTTCMKAQGWREAEHCLWEDSRVGSTTSAQEEETRFMGAMTEGKAYQLIQISLFLQHKHGANN